MNSLLIGGGLSEELVLCKQGENDGNKWEKKKASLGGSSTLFLACVNFVTVSAVYTEFVHTWIAGISQL